MPLNHALVSEIPDNPIHAGEGKVVSSDWNADHVQDAVGLLGATEAGPTDVVAGDDLLALLLPAFGLSGWEKVVVEGQKFILVTWTTGEELLWGPFE